MDSGSCVPLRILKDSKRMANADAVSMGSQVSRIDARDVLSLPCLD